MSRTDELIRDLVPKLSIDGNSVSTSAVIDVINPATAEAFVSVPDAGPAELDHAAAAAHRVGCSWRSRFPEERQDGLLRLVAVIRDHIDELAMLLTLEQGKPLAKARGEIESGLRYCESYASMTLPVEVVRDDASERIEIHRVPLGV